MRKLHLLLSNDDGIEAPGLYNLWLALKEIAEITIVAPLHNQSCKGMGVSPPKNIEIQKRDWPGCDNVWAVDGTPADCIKFALSYLLPSPPHLIVSGINDGSNAGRNILQSGTVGACIKGTFFHVGGIAFSCSWHEGEEKFKNAAPYIVPILNYFLDNPFPEGTLINVTFPPLPEGGFTGVALARQGKSYWDARIADDDIDSERYRVLDTWRHMEEAPDSDIALLANGFITCVPIKVGDLTDEHHFSREKTLFNEHFKGEQ